MASENIDTYGVDISMDGVEYTKKLLEEHGLSDDLKIAGADNIPYEDNYFNGIISYGVLYYCNINEIENVVKEIFRDFSYVFIDEIVETHENKKFCDSNFVIQLIK